MLGTINTIIMKNNGVKSKHDMQTGTLQRELGQWCIYSSQFEKLLHCLPVFTDRDGVLCLHERYVTLLLSTITNRRVA